MENFWKGLLEPEEDTTDNDILLTAVTFTDIPETTATEEEKEEEEEENIIVVDSSIAEEDVIIDTTLHKAVEDGNPEEVKKLLTDGNIVRFINSFDSSGRTPIYIATEKNNKECLKILIENKHSDINKHSSQTGTPAFIAAKSKHIECLNTLVENRGVILGPQSIFDTDDQCIKIHNAVSLRQHDKLKELLENITDDVINEWDKMGRTVLHLAIEKNDVESLRLLLSKGADVNKPNIIGGTPLYFAAYRGNRDCLLEVIRHAPDDVNQSDLFGETPVYAAAFNNDDVCFNILVKIGGNVDEATYLAAVGDHQSCLMFLVERGGDLSYVGRNGETVVEAFFNNISEPTKCMIDILDSKANVEEKDKRTIYKLDFDIFLTRKEKQMQVVSCLLQSMNSDEEADILNHPVCQMYLFAKMSTPVYRWMNIAAIIMWYIYFCFVFFYLGSLTDILNNSYISNKTLGSIVVVLLPFRFIFGVLQVLRIRIHHSLWEIIRAAMHIISVILIVILVVADKKGRSDKNVEGISNWFLILADIVLVLHYIEYISIHMKYRLIGNYYVMFLAVLRRTVIAFISFFFLLFSFVIIFQRQFYYYDEFSNIFRSTIKTVVLMVGELEYDNTFSGQLPINPNATNADIKAKQNLLMPRLMFLIFIIFIHISLLNLMMGLAVENVTDVKKRGNAISLRQQALFLNQAEDLLIFLKKKIFGKLGKILLEKTYVNRTYELEKKRKRLVSRKTFEALSVIARKRRKNKNVLGNNMQSSFYYTAT